jgi:hypothetical protein
MDVNGYATPLTSISDFLNTFVLVNFTYHLESLAYQSTIISESVYNQVGDDYHCVPRGLVFSRGVGGIFTYNLLAKSTVKLPLTPAENQMNETQTTLNNQKGYNISPASNSGRMDDNDGLMTVKMGGKRTSCVIL